MRTSRSYNNDMLLAHAASALRMAASTSAAGLSAFSLATRSL